eukprot:7924258-Alexandrium_andersonii.AAC.1
MHRALCADTSFHRSYLPEWTPNNKRSELELPNTHNCFKCSEVELRGPMNGLNMGPRSSRGMRSAPLFAPIPNLTMKGAVL